jgi:hypothetical protein
MQRRRVLAIAAAVLATAAGPDWGGKRAHAAERIAVFVVGNTPEDRALAEAMSEVVIGQVARTSDAEIAGTEELRAKMAMASEADAAACLADLRCLTRAAVSLAVRRTVSGTVGRTGDRHVFSLECLDLEGSAPPRRVFRAVDGGLAALARAAQSAVDELFTRPPSTTGGLKILAPSPSRVFIDEIPVGTAPLALADLRGGRHAVRIESEARFTWRGTVEVSPGAMRDLAVGDAQMPMHKRWPAPAFWTGVGVTTVALGSSLLFGAMANGEPGGQTRGEIQRNLITIGTVSLVSAAVAATVTAYIALRYRHHIWSGGE